MDVGSGQRCHLKILKSRARCKLLDHLTNVFFVSCVSHAFASVYRCLVVTSWERADLLALAGDV